MKTTDTTQSSIFSHYRSELDRYAEAKFTGILLKGYHGKYNSSRDYKVAKQPIVTKFTAENYRSPSVDELMRHVQNDGWIGHRLPPGIIVIDNENPETMVEIDNICKNNKPPTQRTNNGKQWTFSCNGDVRGADGVYTRSGLKVTYRLSMKNYVIMPPTNGRTWEHTGDLENPPPLPDSLLPCRKNNIDDLLNCLGGEVHRLKNADTWGTYEELLSLSAFLISVGIPEDSTHHIFRIIFGKDYDPRETGYFLNRDRQRINNNEPVIAAGTFFESLKNKGLDNLKKFALAIETLTAEKKTSVKLPGEKKTVSQAEKLIEISSTLTLFHDDMKQAYAELPGQNMKIRSAAFKQWLSKQLWQSERKAPNSDALNQALNVLEAKAVFDGNMRKLSNRIALHEGSILYDLGNGSAVRITPGRWEIITNPPMIFRQYPHQQYQVEPISGGELGNLFKYLNIVKEDHRLLTQVLLVCYFIPEIAHPILHPWGDQGSGKTTICNIFKLLIDPSRLSVFFAPRDLNETIQALEHHYFLAFDNLSEIPAWLSDLLSQAVTGAGLSKRKLYTDDEDHVFQLKRCVAVNGINQLIYKPDAMDRSILIHHSRIDPRHRRSETSLYNEFEKERSYLIGAVFDILARAMQIFPAVQLSQLPRMADFALWGCAITQALGYTQQDFLEAYSNNMKAQNSEIIGGNTLAQAVLSFMDDNETWESTVGEAFAKLLDIAKPKDRDRTFPKAPNKLRKYLERIRPNLLDYGVKFTIDEFHAETGVHITFQKLPIIPSESSALQGAGRIRELRPEDKLNVQDTPSAPSGAPSGQNINNSNCSEHPEHPEDRKVNFLEDKEFIPEIDDPTSDRWVP